MTLFPHWPKVRELELASSSFKVIVLLPQSSHLDIGQRVLLSQGYCQQVWLIATTWFAGN